MAVAVEMENCHYSKVGCCARWRSLNTRIFCLKDTSRMTASYIDTHTPPPATLEESRNRRQRTRASGLSPNHWYAMEFSNKVKSGEVTEVTFWKRSFALFRGSDGVARAIENRCAHRQVKLTKGEVIGCRLHCPYHGWGYEGDGRVTQIPHELFGRDMPNFKIRSYPVKEKYGLIWLFPGDPELAETTAMPHLPELHQENPWHFRPVDFEWDAHHSMVLDNVSDYTHGWLHRKYEPFRDPKLTRVETIGDTVHVEYETQIGAGKIINAFIPRTNVNSNHIHLSYEYPYHTSNTDDFIKHFIITVPVSERRSRVFFIFYYKALSIPGTNRPIPRWLMKPALAIGNRLLVRPLLQEDGDVLEEEQRGWEEAWDSPQAELNPIVKEFQDLTIRKWREYEDSVRAKKKSTKSPKAAVRSVSDTKGAAQ